jgi:hypothetical protein
MQCNFDLFLIPFQLNQTTTGFVLQDTGKNEYIHSCILNVFEQRARGIRSMQIKHDTQELVCPKVKMF